MSLRILNFFHAATQFGWFFFGFGMVFFVVFGMQSDFSFVTFRDATGRAVGRVIGTEKTGASENKQAVLASHYEYSVAGNTFRGISYATGDAPPPGARVTVEYVQAEPARSRIEGMRRALFGPWAAPVSAIFPAVGIAIVFFATRTGIKRNRLLREGLLAQGILKSKRPTSVIVNRRTVWELKFEFTDRLGQRHEVTVKSNDPARLADEASEPLLYDPAEPSRAYILDEAPSRPRFERNGELIGRPLAALGALIIPALVLGGGALYFAWKLDLVRL